MGIDPSRYLIQVDADAGKFPQSLFLFQRFPQKDTKAGLADVIRHAQSIHTHVQAHSVALLRAHSHNNNGSANRLDALTAFPAFGLFGVRRGGVPRQP